MSSRRISALPNRILTVVVFSALLLIALTGIDILVLSRQNLAEAFSPHYYMALGDSLSFGYQPNFDFSSGFADDIFNDLHPAGVTAVVNYACAGETTETMIHGGCPGRIAHHGSYTGAQLQAAVNFLKAERNQGRVSPITLEIGSNDMVADWDPSICSIKAGTDVDADLARMDANLTQVILPQLVAALGNHTKANNGDLHLLNYYNPYAKQCPDSGAFVHELNDHLAADAAKFRVPVVDVYGAFGGDANMANKICDYTWICDPRFHDIHPTNDGYKVIAKAVEVALGLPGTGPLPGIIPPWNFLPPLGAMPDQLAEAHRRLDAARAA
ncbi:MAG TPA: SGNH/GDSL hydrolase family protein [Ktedonobacterales bacterium]